VWKFDTTTARSLIQDHLQTDLWPVLHNPPPWADINFVVASKSSRWQAADVAPKLQQLIAANAVPVTTLEGGHWIHVDNPHGVTDVIVKTLGR
jgi:hypothetical protein